MTYDWFEREYGSQYKLSLTKEQYDRMKSIVAPIGKSNLIQLEFIFSFSDVEGKPLTFDQFCDILIPVITGGEDDQHDDYAIWLAFRSFDRNDDGYIQANELEMLMQIIGKSVNPERIRTLIQRVDWDDNNQLDFKEFRQFIIRGYARDLLMMDITRDIIYSNQRLEFPLKTTE